MFDPVAKPGDLSTADRATNVDLWGRTDMVAASLGPIQTASSSGAQLIAETATIAGTAYPVSLTAARQLVCSAGLGTITCSSTGLFRQIVLVAAQGTIVGSGSPAALLMWRALTASTGVGQLLGQSATLSRSALLQAQPGAGAVSASNVGLFRSSTIQAEVAVGLIAPFSATLAKASVLVASTAAGSISASPTQLLAQLLLSLSAGVGEIVSQDASLGVVRALTCVTGVGTVVGPPVSLELAGEPAIPVSPPVQSPAPPGGSTSWAPPSFINYDSPTIRVPRRTKAANDAPRPPRAKRATKKASGGAKVAGPVPISRKVSAAAVEAERASAELVAGLRAARRREAVRFAIPSAVIAGASVMVGVAAPVAMLIGWAAFAALRWTSPLGRSIVVEHHHVHEARTALDVHHVHHHEVRETRSLRQDRSSA